MIRADRDNYYFGGQSVMLAGSEVISGDSEAKAVTTCSSAIRKSSNV